MQATCPKSGAAFNGLTQNGIWQLTVRAVDPSGNVDFTPAARSWVVDTTPPIVHLTNGPATNTTTNARTADFDVSTSDGTLVRRGKLPKGGVLGPAERRWYDDAMRSTIDGAGRLVVPKPLRDELGFQPGTELEMAAVDGRLEISVPSRVRVEDGPHGPRLVADDAEPLTATDVRALIDRSRR